MSVVECSFASTDLFPQLRNGTFLVGGVRRGLHDKGMFVGRDTTLSLVFVVADAAFYRLEVFQRPNGEKFTVAAQSATTGTNVRAIINGAKYDDTNIDFSKPETWRGPVIQEGNDMDGWLAEPDHLYYAGQASGRGMDAYSFGPGDPFDASPIPLHAIAGLCPLVYAKLAVLPQAPSNPPTLGSRFGPFEVFTDYVSARRPKGKVAYGIHRATGLVFFLASEDPGASWTDSLPILTLINQLVTHGVDDALLGDGSTSASLIVDGTVEAEPIFYKDNGIPWGLLLRLEVPTVTSGITSFTEIDDPVLADLVGDGPLTGAQARMDWTATGLQLTISSFGGNLSAEDMHVESLPLTLDAVSGSDIAEGVIFRNGATSVEVVCTMVVRDASDRGALSGTFYIVETDATTTTPICEGTIDWPLE